MKMKLATGTIAVLYSNGGTADVGRHAVKAALEGFPGSVRVITREPEKTLFQQKKWNSYGEYAFTDAERERLDVRSVDVTKDDLEGHLENVDAVISALGNRQPWYGDRVAKKGTENLIKAMSKVGVRRLVAVTTVGVNEDWPPMEFHWAGKALSFIFLISHSHKDLEGAEKFITSASEDLDYVIVRPVGLGEDRKPVGEWFVQEKKNEGKLGPDMSKMDCARFAVSEVLDPKYHRQAIVVGSNWENFEMNPKDESL